MRAVSHTFYLEDFSSWCREGNGTPLQYSCLENHMDGGAWWAAVHGVAEGWTQLSNFTFTFHFNASEKEMSTHSSVLAWRIPGTGEPDGLSSMGSHRVGHDWSDLAAAAAAARNCKDAENTRLGEVRGRGLDTNVHLSAEGTSCVGKVRLHLLEAVGYLTF